MKFSENLVTEMCRQNSSVSTPALIRTESKIKSNVYNVCYEQYDTNLFVIINTAME